MHTRRGIEKNKLRPYIVDYILPGNNKEKLKRQHSDSFSTFRLQIEDNFIDKIQNDISAP